MDKPCKHYAMRKKPVTNINFIYMKFPEYVMHRDRKYTGGCHGVGESRLGVRGLAAYVNGVSFLGDGCSKNDCGAGCTTLNILKATEFTPYLGEFYGI